MKTERRNITQPADWWVAFEKKADKEGMTLSEWVGWCCVEFLPHYQQLGLSKRPPAHRPKKDPR